MREKFAKAAFAHAVASVGLATVVLFANNSYSTFATSTHFVVEVQDGAGRPALNNFICGSACTGQEEPSSVAEKKHTDHQFEDPAPQMGKSGGEG